MRENFVFAYSDSARRGQRAEGSERVGQTEATFAKQIVSKFLQK